MLQAKALYDNVAEGPEELSVRRGDVLTVIEQDTSGLEGWWLCSLNNRRGIVPGNRLRLLDKKLTEKELSRINQNKLAGESKKDWHMPDKVVIPQRHGNMFVYDKSKQGLSTGHNTDYDVPPARNPQPAPRNLNPDYDHPPTNPLYKTSPLADHAQRLQMQMHSLDHYDVPGSNRSSTISMLSMGSNISATSSGSGPHSSVCESERSSLDLSGHDVYDVPPPARGIHREPAKHDSASFDSGVYDTPKSLRHGQQKLVNQGDLFIDQSFSNTNENVYDKIDDNNISSVSSKSNQYSRSYSPSLSRQAVNGDSVQSYDVVQKLDSSQDSMQENDYDTPKSNARVADLTIESSKFNVYDVPPLVSKDTGNSIAPKLVDPRSVSPARQESSGVTTPSKELATDLNIAMESLVNLQHCVNSSCSKLLGYVHISWRTPNNLEPKVYEIKLATIAVKKAGDNLLNFAKAALGNIADSEERRLVDKLAKAVGTLDEALDAFGNNLSTLNKGMWPLVNLVREKGFVPSKSDELDSMIDITRNIPECVRSISGLIQGNSMMFFKRGENAELVASTTKLKPKTPPQVKPKPRVSIGSSAPMAKFVTKSESSTPSPADVPVDPFPAACGDSPPVRDVPQDSDRQLDYDVPKPAKVHSSSESTKVAPVAGNTTDEYDYVSLTKERLDKQRHQTASEDIGKTPVYAQVKKETPPRRVVKSIYPPETNAMSSKFHEQLEKLQKESEEEVKIYSEDYDVPASNPVKQVLSNQSSLTKLVPNDQMILTFYAKQFETHTDILISAIETFLRSIDENQAPKVFVTYSKFVILAAHKLVYIGDTLTRNLVHDTIRNDIMNHSYKLCEVLKVTVTATKKAALDFPSVQLTQDMVDRVSEVSVVASSLKTYVTKIVS